MRLPKRLKSLLSSSASRRTSTAPAVSPDVELKEVYAALAQAESARIPLTVEELLSQDGAAFVQASYLMFLKRGADAEGLMVHKRMLDHGASKIAVAYEIARSDEAHAKFTSGSVEAREVFQLKLAEVLSQAGLEESVNRLLHFSREQMLWSLPPKQQDSSAAGQKASSLQSPVTALASSALLLRPGSTPTPGGSLVSPGQVWMDLTTAFEWTGGVVGIVRAELEVAVGMKKIDPSIRFSMQVGEGFAEIAEAELHWLLNAENVVDAYMTFFGRYPGQASSAKSIHVSVPEESGFFYPYGAGDVVFAMGWMDSKKEEKFAQLKGERSDVYVCYLVYDTIVLGETTRHFYGIEGRERFHAYMKWLSHHCDFLMFGGETAKSDTEALQLQHGWRMPPGRAVKFGTDIMKSVDASMEKDLLAEAGVTGPFIITVGSIEPRKNHDTLYRAYLMALEMDEASVPQLVVCGKPMWRATDLIDSLDRDPRLKGRLIHLAPTDAQLAALYKNCLFTLLPSIYEGWSLTLPESLGQGKFCLTCETPPLREIGRDLVDYAEPFDVKGWAEKILLYAKDRDLLAEKEARIAAEWPKTRWFDTAGAVHQNLLDFRKAYQPESATPYPEDVADPAESATIWMDLTLTYLHQQNASLSGIVRAELTYAYYLKKIDPRTRFFAHENGYGGYFFEIPDEDLEWLFEAKDLTAAYQGFHDVWREREASGTAWRDPIRKTWPRIEGEALIKAFPRNSIIFFAAIDSDGSGTLHRTKNLSRVVSDKKAVSTSHLIYDFTPILIPHVHTPETVRGYKPFIENVSERFDHLVFGGRTAQRDGARIQLENGWRSPPSDFIEFGADLALTQKANGRSDSARAKRILSELGVSGPYLMTVGTIEPRKNHEMLYKAYLHMLQAELLETPIQLVIVGRPGWKSSDFLDTMRADERVRDRILVLTPSDEELDILYANCAFTLLPSFYEGWSLTLPESFRYGKFCIVSDVEPLRETGGDFAEYVHPLDTYAWAERIAYYAKNPAAVAEREFRIRNGWTIKTWEDSTRDLIGLLHRAHRARFGFPPVVDEGIRAPKSVDGKRPRPSISRSRAKSNPSAGA